jgi:hypothetical protein
MSERDIPNERPPKIIGRITRPGYHRCDVPGTRDEGIFPGTVAECTICGTWWLLDWRGEGWTRATIWHRFLIRWSRKEKRP